jgi:integrase
MAHVRKIPNAAPGTKAWECRWSFPGPDGKRRFQKKRFNTKGEAEAHRRAMEDRVSASQSVDQNPGKQPFNVWAERWFSSLEGKKKPATLRGYRSILNNTVLPSFGYRRIASITPADVDEWLTGLRTRQPRALAPPTIHRHYGVLRLVLMYAARMGAITQNPALNAELPTDKSTGRRKPEPVFLSPAEVERLAQQLPEPYDLLVRFLAYTGLRVAEASGLNVGDVDLQAGRQIKVTRTRTKVKGGWEVHVPKNGKPRRVPLLPGWLRDDMREYMENHPNRDNPAAPLFPGTTQQRTRGESGSRRAVDWDKPWEPGTFHKRQFKAALAAAGLPRRTRQHDLRHTAASLMLATGIPPYRAAEYLGHSLQVLTTTYAHILPDSVEDDAALFGERPRPTTATNVVRLGA